MVDVTVSPPTGEDELVALAREHRRTYSWTSEAYEEWLEDKRRRPENVRVVRRGGQVAGGLVLLPMGQWFGGRSVPMTGIGSVGIDPAARAAGLASELMRSVLAELYASGVALSALYPATQPVYRRTGYELAGSWILYRVPTDAIDVRDRELDLRRIEDPSRSHFEGLYSERARRTAGNLDRGQTLWQRILKAPDTDVHAYVVGNDSGPQGYAIFTQSRPPSEWKYDLDLRDLVALTPAAARRLWTFFADHRSFAGRVRWRGGVGDPFVLHLREQDWSIEQSWTWMLRIVDVERAVRERGYPSSLDLEVAFALRDETLRANEGSYVLRVFGGKAEVERGGTPRVRLDVRGLAALYTGFLGAEELAAAGLAEGPEEDLARLSTVFAGPSPWLADFF